jgi:hypothetical protein
LSTQFDFEIQPVLTAFGVLCFSKLITPRISHYVAQETSHRDEVQRFNRTIAGKFIPTSAQGDYGGQHSSVSHCLPKLLDLGSLIGKPDFGDRPDIGLKVNPLLLAPQGESTVIPSPRAVP